MAEISRNGLVEQAGRIYVLKKELAAKQAERDKLEQDIKTIDRKLAQALEAFDATWKELAKAADGHAGRDGKQADDPLTAGKLPHRVLLHIRRDPSRLHTASEIAGELKVRDVQKVRTALARLVGKGLIRRAGVRGEFTV